MNKLSNRVPWWHELLNQTTEHSYTPLLVLFLVAQPSWLRAQASGLCYQGILGRRCTNVLWFDLARALKQAGSLFYHFLHYRFNS
jgi:hypothetical protein